MPFLDRFRNPKTATDSSSRDASVIVVDQNAGFSKDDPFNFITNLILFKKDNILNVGHREEVARFDPYAQMICYGIPYATFDDGFKFVDDSGKDIPALAPLLVMLEELHHRDVMKQLDQYARVHGWSAGYLSEKSMAATDALDDKDKLTQLVQTPLQPGTPIGRIQPYAGVRDITVHSTDFLGNPTMYEIIQSVKQSHQENEVKFLVHPSRLLSVTPHPIRFGQVEGRTALDAVWDAMVLRRNMELAMALSSIKYGGGVLVAQKETGSWSEEELAEAKRELHRVSTKQALLAPSGTNISWEGPSGNVDYPSQIAQLVKSISAGSGIPKTVFEGVEAGVLSGAQTNMQELYMTVSKNQEIFENVYQRLGAFLIPAVTSILMQAHFDWAFAFTMSAIEKADVDLKKAQVISEKLQTWTINEARKEEGKGPVEGGDMVLSIKGMESPLFGAKVDNPEEEGDEPPPEQDEEEEEDALIPTPREIEVIAYACDVYGKDFQSFREMDAYLIGISGVTKLCMGAKCSKGSYYGWRVKYA